VEKVLIVNPPKIVLDVFDNPAGARDQLTHVTLPEFTCLCPKTGQPDFAKHELVYVPDELCIELKSLKQYAWTFRDRGVFHEACSGEMFEQFWFAIRPRWMRLTSRWYVRGGIYTTIVSEDRQVGYDVPDWIYENANQQRDSSENYA
jgi:7-cyano-7-deazaguanine reductase